MPQLSFSADIKPFFRAIDISHMKRFGVELDNYTYMSNPDNANSVRATLLTGARASKEQLFNPGIDPITHNGLPQTKCGRYVDLVSQSQDT